MRSAQSVATLFSWRVSLIGFAIVGASLVIARDGYGRDVFASSWEGPASESDGTEYIYNGSTSNPEATHYFDGWFPFPAGNASSTTFPFGNTDLRTYTTNANGVTIGAQGLVVSKSAGFFSLQR